LARKKREGGNKGKQRSLGVIEDGISDMDSAKKKKRMRKGGEGLAGNKLRHYVFMGINQAITGKGETSFERKISCT